MRDIARDGFNRRVVIRPKASPVGGKQLSEEGNR